MVEEQKKESKNLFQERIKELIVYQKNYKQPRIYQLKNNIYINPSFKNFFFPMNKFFLIISCSLSK